jgi:predicted nucleotidyltransferase
MMLSDLKKDFEFIRDEVEGVLLFGSAAKGELSKRSDIDIALVRPKNKRVLLRVFERLGGKYDVKIFEDLPLYIKMDIIKNHQIIFGDEVELSYYFYRLRKEWKDMEYRIKSNQFKSVVEMINQRRAWLKNERKIPQED